MEGVGIKLDFDQRARSVALEPQVLDDPEWACGAIVWQRDRIAALEAQLAASEAKCAELESEQVIWNRYNGSLTEAIDQRNAALTRAEKAERLAVPIDAFEVVKSIQGPLWDAIHRFTAGCGGDVSRHVYGNVARMNAVAEVNEVIRAALRQAEAKGR